MSDRHEPVAGLTATRMDAILRGAVPLTTRETQFYCEHSRGLTPEESETVDAQVKGGGAGLTMTVSEGVAWGANWPESYPKDTPLPHWGPTCVLCAALVARVGSDPEPAPLESGPIASEGHSQGDELPRIRVPDRGELPASEADLANPGPRDKWVGPPVPLADEASGD